MRFEAALARELARSPRPTAVVAHMCPIYAVLAAPLARPLGVRVLLWFTHWRSSRLLRAAERAATDVITVERRSFPLDSRKVIPIGHGIDLTEFACVERTRAVTPALLSLGRTSPAKGLETVIRAVAEVPGARLSQVGPSLTDEERSHRARLERLVGELGVEDRVEIAPPVPRQEVVRLLASADALVNNMRAGATDKVVFEAAATCLPVLASNPALGDFLPESMRFPRDDVGRPGREDPLARRDRPCGASVVTCAGASSGATRSKAGPAVSSRLHPGELAGRPARRQGDEDLRFGEPPAPAPPTAP